MHPISFCNGGIKMDNRGTSPLLVCGALFVFKIRGGINPPIVASRPFLFFFLCKETRYKRKTDSSGPEYRLELYSARCVLMADSRFSTRVTSTFRQRALKSRERC